MLLIDCPHCGLRDETEFACGGEAHIARPLAENAISDAEFAEYLFWRDNPKGVFLERWCHTAGCRRWFNAARDTVTHEFIEIYAMGSLPKSKQEKQPMLMLGVVIPHQRLQLNHLENPHLAKGQIMSNKTPNLNKMKQGNMRLDKGGRIDRKKPVTFRFDGKAFAGFEGDTLASALLANGVHLVGRSFKYHRPRGILTAGYDEPNALVEIGSGNQQAPNIRATEAILHDGLTARSQNRWPSLSFDIGAVNSLLGRFFLLDFTIKPLCFQLHSGNGFMSQLSVSAAGLGRAAKDHNDPDRYEKTHRHTDVLIVGGGVSGLMAALSAGQSGARVMLVDDARELGGWMLSENNTHLDGKPAIDWIKSTTVTLEAMANVTILTRTQCFGYMDHNFLTLAEKVTDHLAERPDHLPRQRMWKIRAKHVILAQGNHERPLIFGGNDKPGVMMAGAVRSYINRYAVIPGRRAVVYTNNDDAYKSALSLEDAGVKVAAIIDQRPAPSSVLVSQAMARGITVHAGHAVLDAKGTRHVGTVKIAAINPKSGDVTGQPFYLDADLVAMSGGFTPVVNLHSQARGKITWDEDQLCFRPSEYHEACLSVGACNGIFGQLKDAMADAAKAGSVAATAAGFKVSAPETPDVSEPDMVMRPHLLWKMPSDAVKGQEPKAFVDFQNDVTASDIKLAVREGYHSVEHVKRYTTNGMATDQGEDVKYQCSWYSVRSIGQTHSGCRHNDLPLSLYPDHIRRYCRT